MSDNMINIEGSPSPRGERKFFHAPNIHRRHAIPAGGVPPTPAEAAEFNAGPVKKGWVEKVVGNKKIRTAVILTGGASGLQVGHAINPDIPDVPGIYRSIEQGINAGINTLRGSRDIIPPTFSNAINEIIIVQAGINAMPATNEDISLLSENSIQPPLKDNPYPTISLIFPGILQQGDKINITKGGGTFVSSVDAKTGEPTYSSSVGGYEIIFERQGTKIIPGVLDQQARTIEAFKMAPKIVEDKPYFTQFVLRITRNDGLRYEISFNAVDDIRALVPLPILDDAPILEEELVHEGNHDVLRYRNPDQPGKIISGTTPILETGIANARISYGVGGNKVSSETTIPIFKDVTLLTNANGQLEFHP